MKQPAARWGVVVFQDEQGRYVLQVPLAQWLPEAGAIGSAQLRPRDCLSRAGLKQLADDLNVPISESQTPWGREVFESPGGGRYDRASNVDLPIWHSWVRGIGIFGWLIALILSFAMGGDSWGLVVAASALLMVPGSDVAVRALAWWRTRGDGRVSNATVVRPSPEADAGATRRFRETACVRVMPGEVVLTNTVGEERWYARRAAHGIARLVRLTHPKTRECLGIELRDADGQARALLPWRWWFAGPDGEQRWAELVAALELPVSDENFQPAKNTGPAESPDSWWQKHELGGDAMKMAAMDGKDIRRATSWQAVVIGGSEPIVIPIFSALLLAGLFSDAVPARVAGILSALTVALVLGPVLAHQLTSRLAYDRPDVAERS
ncbi:hypothetical protein [Streptomyces yerevanensis]|uniref:hypothetical protein n=1 Tax=Streptomyces yerevanensis TaxID=66378 RepID=UPI0012FED81E|nr:hypothetical protein [Streptomyces yerevanensis]